MEKERPSEMSEMWDLAVIGGGAAGMACAISAAQRGLKVVLLERMKTVGKKLLATGNGRCNLMNSGKGVYPVGQAFADIVLQKCGYPQQKAFWQDWGLRLREEESGRLYPVTGQATSVLDTLQLALTVSGVQVRTEAVVKRIRHVDGRFIVILEDDHLAARQVCITCGGQAQPALGSDGSGYELLAALGHTIAPPEPVLTALECDKAPLKGLSGERVRCLVSVMEGDNCLHQEKGEVLFTDYGLSGVVIMNCAGYARKGTEIRLNLLPAMSFESKAAAMNELRRRRRQWGMLPLSQVLTGVASGNLSSALCKAAGILWKNRNLSDLRDGEIQRLCDTMAAFPVTVEARRGFQQAQVTRGGALVEEFEATTLQSKRVKGLYAAGEMLNVDGACGGYNLMFAFGSGLVAGSSVEGKKK